MVDSTDSEHVAEDSAIDFIYGVIQSRSALFFGIWFAIFAVAVAYSFLARPVYRAELLMTPAKQEDSGFGSGIGGQLGQIASFAGLEVGGSDEVQANLAILESHHFTLEFIRRNELLPILYEDAWDREARDWVAGKAVTDWEVLEDFNRNVRSVTYEPATGLVRLRIDWFSPQAAADWANRMGKDLNERVRQRAIRESSESISYLKEELAQNNLVGVDQAINGLIESQINKIMLANVRRDYAFQVIDPAIAPSLSSPLRPNKPLLASIGLVFGFLCATFTVMFVGRRRSE